MSMGTSSVFLGDTLEVVLDGVVEGGAELISFEADGSFVDVFFVVSFVVFSFSGWLGSIPVLAGIFSWYVAIIFFGLFFF